MKHTLFETVSVLYSDNLWLHVELLSCWHIMCKLRTVMSDVISTRDLSFLRNEMILILPFPTDLTGAHYNILVKTRPRNSVVLF